MSVNFANYKGGEFRLALDVGHGLYTSGKETPDKIKEWSLNDPIADALQKRFLDYAFTKVIRLDNDEGNVDESLKWRTDTANANKVHFLLSIHHNASTGVWSWAFGGTETYIYPVRDAHYNESRALATLIQAKTVEIYKLRDRGVKEANFHMLRENRSPSVLLEVGFMDSLADKNTIRNLANQQALGRALADVIAQYYGLKLKAQPKPVNKPQELKVEKVATKTVKVPVTTYIDKVQKPYMVLNKNASLWAFDVQSWGDFKEVKQYPKGTELELADIVTNKLGARYGRTPYSSNGKIYNGFNTADFTIVYK